MWDSAEELVKKLRGPKVPFLLVNAETMLLDPGSYLFPSGIGAAKPIEIKARV